MIVKASALIFFAFFFSFSAKFTFVKAAAFIKISG